MIFWDEKNSLPFIRKRDGSQVNLMMIADEFAVANTDVKERKAEDKIKKSIDALVGDSGYVVEIRLLEKEPLGYLIWMGNTGDKPPENWWELGAEILEPALPPNPPTEGKASGLSV